MDVAIEKATELGVHRIAPVIAERSTVTISSAHHERTGNSRWRKRAVEACKQSGNPFLPEILPVCSLTNYIQSASDSGELRFFGSPKGRRDDFHKSLATQSFSGISWIIGPEGGFSQAEEIRMRERGFLSVDLGPNTLRAETATVAALAVTVFALSA